MKRSTTTRLLLMGAAPLLFTACQNEPDVRQGLYTTVEACTRETGDAASCKQAFDSAQKQSADQAPRYATREQCKVDWGEDRCAEQRDSQGHSFIGPLMAGFFMSQMLNNRAGFNAAPAYQNRDNGWLRPTPGARPDTSGAFRTGTTGMTPVNATPNRAVTVSRGGFGARSSGRASFGG
ncbi:MULTISPECIES: DUF1190 domain-containing protein [Pseudoxanthomonas]|jgi:uncharacterized protein YgiB involved in biofilm formation|uniref:DUF1190 domain-containing protein n=1 Tax=Pseudoxanthomonas winnipegensis TaxID=2480810 RepID=A0A4Q8LAC3_9GAMM|nr:MULTISPECIES: DUF1190 domain-containing protein [Pseudoxanthomonas]TAA25573.1 DUF1190 domain-containing protein [Pseudoxanthomonas winnipegensis]TMN18897.1 DUF1190 domain-containing protein [Pseudoxanthomonas sp. X-1]UAY74931.1 DUF1190 domain-containing protein [Pseudoxanthomonas sp. X-1]